MSQKYIKKDLELIKLRYDNKELIGQETDDDYWFLIIHYGKLHTHNNVLFKKRDYYSLFLF